MVALVRATNNHHSKGLGLKASGAKAGLKSGLHGSSEETISLNL